MRRQVYALTIGFWLGIGGTSVWSQLPEEMHQGSGDHTNGIWETIATGIVSYSFGEEEAIAGSELHVTYWMTHQYGTGMSYTARFAHEELWNDLALLASWNPLKWMTVNAGPNFAFAASERPFTLGAYAETEINWRFHEQFHVGPIVGTVISQHTEASIGLHFGIEW